MAFRLGLCSLLIALTSFATTAQAQDDDGGSTDHRFNVRIAPLGALLGWYNIDAEMAVTDQFAIGPTVTILNLDPEVDSNTDKVKLDVSQQKFGVRGTYYPRGVFQTGWYVTPMVQYYKVDVKGTSTTTGTRATADNSGVVFTGLVGYHWFWDNFNLNLGAGYDFTTTGKTKVKFSDGRPDEEINTGGAGLSLDFMIGIAF